MTIAKKLRSKLRPSGLAWLIAHILVSRERAIEEIWAFYRAVGVKKTATEIAVTVDAKISQYFLDPRNLRDLALAMLLRRHPDLNMINRVDFRPDIVVYGCDIIFNWIIEDHKVLHLHSVLSTGPLILNPASADSDRTLDWFPELKFNESTFDFIDPISLLLVEQKINSAIGQLGLIVKKHSTPQVMQDWLEAKRLMKTEEDLSALRMACAGHRIVCILTDGFGWTMQGINRETREYTGPRTVEERRRRLFATKESCRIETFLPPWEIIGWTQYGNIRFFVNQKDAGSTKAGGKEGWFIHSREMIEHRVMNVTVEPREFYREMDGVPDFDSLGLVDQMIDLAESRPLWTGEIQPILKQYRHLVVSP